MIIRSTGRLRNSNLPSLSVSAMGSPDEVCPNHSGSPGMGRWSPYPSTTRPTTVGPLGTVGLTSGVARSSAGAGEAGGTLAGVEVQATRIESNTNPAIRCSVIFVAFIA